MGIKEDVLQECWDKIARSRNADGRKEPSGFGIHDGEATYIDAVLLDMLVEVRIKLAELDEAVKKNATDIKAKV
jgi:hypothetical protein